MLQIIPKSKLNFKDDNEIPNVFSFKIQQYNYVSQFVWRIQVGVVDFAHHRIHLFLIRMSELTSRLVHLSIALQINMSLL